MKKILLLHSPSSSTHSFSSSAYPSGVRYSIIIGTEPHLFRNVFKLSLVKTWSNSEVMFSWMSFFELNSHEFPFRCIRSGFFHGWRWEDKSSGWSPPPKRCAVSTHRPICGHCVEMSYVSFINVSKSSNGSFSNTSFTLGWAFFIMWERRSMRMGVDLIGPSAGFSAPPFFTSSASFSTLFFGRPLFPGVFFSFYTFTADEL